MVKHTCPHGIEFESEQQYLRHMESAHDGFTFKQKKLGTAQFDRYFSNS